MCNENIVGIWRLVRIAWDVSGGIRPIDSMPLPCGSSTEALLAAVRDLPEGIHTHIMMEPAPGRADPAHITAMIAEAGRFPEAVIIGCGAKARGLAASAERLCLRLETGMHLADPRSPYRIFPLPPLRRFAAKRRRRGLRHTELLTHLMWGGVPIHTVTLPGRVATGGTPMFFRHIGLLLRRLAPWPYPRLCDGLSVKPPDWRHPIRLFRTMLAEHTSPLDLAIAAFTGVFMGALPLIACHTVAILYVTTRFRLNRAMAVAAQNLCAPPVVPVLCVEVGYFLRHGSWLTEVSRQTMLRELHQRLLEWLLGSLIVGPVLGLITAGATLVIARALARWFRENRAQTRINDRRRGNRLGFLSFEVALRLFGRRGAYGLLRMVALYYLLFDPLVRRLALPYLSRRFPDHTGWRRVVDLYRLIYSQGTSLVDRYRMMSTPQVFTQGVANYATVRPLVEDRANGFILLVSHVGNWQALMLALQRMNRGITLLMRPEENPVTRARLRFQDSAQPFRFVSPDTPMGGVIELTRRFREGDIIAIMGDRAYAAATLPVEFMGAPAQFPCGPFQLAAAWECPVVPMFAAKTGVDAYTVDMAGIIRVERAGDRRENLRCAMQAYASRLQEFAERHPYQVYLFEDVWRPATVRNSSSRPATPAAN